MKKIYIELRIDNKDNYTDEVLEGVIEGVLEQNEALIKLGFNPVVSKVSFNLPTFVSTDINHNN